MKYSERRADWALGCWILAGLYYNLQTGVEHGFLIRRGKFESFDVPGSTLTAIWA